MPGTASSHASNSLQKRTRNGCQTCKKRRKRCDEKRPVCGGCSKLNIQCIYGLNVRWGSTRESFILSTMPQTGLGLGTRDSLHELLQSIKTSPKLHRMIDSTLDGEGRGILLKFLTSGYKLLASDFSLDDTWLTTVFPQCESSKACLLSLLAFQTATDHDYENSFDRYYDQALSQFTKETCSLGEDPKPSLFFAGLFMCTIHFSRLMPYTNHLNAIINMVTSWVEVEPTISTRPDTQEFLSLLGFLDFQTHTLNRMTPQNYLWYKHCRGRGGIYRISGLPRSLMDLLSGVHMPGAEQALLSWTPPLGEPAQICLWKASRFAGILSAYEIKLQNSLSPNLLTWSVEPLLTPQVLVHNILSLIQQCLVFLPSESSRFKQTLIYPLVMAASQRFVLASADKDFICRTIQDFANERNHFAYQGILGVIQEFWKSGDISIEATANRLEIELPLL